MIVMGLALATAIISDGGPVSDQVIDGWPIGAQTKDCLRGSCEVMIDAARVRLDVRDRGHAYVVTVTIHEVGKVVNAQGRIVLTNGSGGSPRVVRFKLADGTRRAIGVGYPGISRDPVAMDAFQRLLIRVRWGLLTRGPSTTPPLQRASSPGACAAIATGVDTRETAQRASMSRSSGA